MPIHLSHFLSKSFDKYRYIFLWNNQKNLLFTKKKIRKNNQISKYHAFSFI